MAPRDTSATHQAPRARGVLRPGLLTAVVLIGADLALLGYRAIDRSSIGGARAQQADARESAPQLTRDGARIIVPPGSPLRRKLVVDAVADRDIQRTLVLPATVEADPARLVKVLPPLAGRITRLNVQLGERVETGQPLLVLDAPDLETAHADLDRAKVLLALALKNRDRQRALAKIGGAALKDQQQAETDYVTADVEYHRADARLRQIGVNPDAEDKSRTVTIAAPITGSITDLAVAPGAFWNDPTVPLMTVADLSTVWVTANVPEKDTSLIAKDQQVEVTFPAYPTEIFKGKVLFVSDVLDPDTRRTKVRIAFNNPDIRLKPNMFASVRFLTPKQSAPVVPTTALMMRGDGDGVYVEVAPWEFESRAVETGFQQDNRVIVTSGLKAGDRIIVKGGVLLGD